MATGPGAALHRWLLCGILAWIVCGLAGQLHLAWRGTPVESVDLLFDDAYYYLGVAWNVAHGNGSRFTNPLQTNGYHPLWLLLLAGLARLLDLSRWGLFAATLVLTAAVQCLAIVCFGRGETDPLRRSAGRIALFIAMIKFPYVFSAGMETTLFALFIPWLLRRAKAFDWSDRHAFGVGLLLSAVFLTRLDALALDVAVLALAWASGRARLRRVAVALAPLALSLAVYAAVNQQLFGTPLPVSGQAKAIGSALGANLGTSWDFMGSLRFAIALLAATAVVRATAAPALRIERFELSCLGLALLACALYYGVLSGWPIWPWYLYPNAFFTVYATLSGLLAAAVLLARLRAALARRAGARLAGPLVTALVLAFAGIYLGRVASAEVQVRGHLLAYFFGHEIRPPQASSFNRQNVALIPWLTAHYPGGATIAMGDRAGGLGYWLPERYALLQIEGLVADRSFLQVLRSGTLEPYLARQGVDLYIGDRPHALSNDGVLGFVEPVQAKVTRGPLNLLCFGPGAQLLAQDYRWGDAPQLRRVFDYRRRIPCPGGLLKQAQALQQRYGGIRDQAGL